MRIRMRLLKEENGDLFFTAIIIGFKRILRLVFKSPNLSRQEKLSEVKRICGIIMRFDSGAFTEQDAIETWIALGAVPIHHPASFVTDQVRRR